MPYITRFSEDGTQSFECDGCGVVFPTVAGAYQIIRGVATYRMGYEDHAYYCHGCDHYRCEDADYEWCNSCDERRCEFCAPNHSHFRRTRRPTGAIHDYGYKPRPIWFTDGEDSPYHIGFELEISADDSQDASAIAEWSADEGHAPNLFYAKEDSSVDGFEIVSHPMTPGFFHAFRWDAFFDMLEDNYPCPYGEPVDQHGLHVHVSRTAFEKPSRLGAFSYLLQRRRNQSHVERVARRRSHWGDFSAKPVTDVLPSHIPSERAAIKWRDMVQDLVYNHGMRHGYAEMYAFKSARQICQFRTDRGYPPRGAVNLQNGDTVEVRASGSTRVPDDFRASVDLVILSADYVRSLQPCHATSVADLLTWDAFADYVESRKDIAPTVAQIISGR